MKQVFKSVLIASALCAGLSSCNDAARVSGRIEGCPAGAPVVLKTLEGAVTDSVKVSGNGDFSLRVKLPSGAPDFYYLYYKDTKVASLLLAPSDRISLQCDTLGARWTVEGSADCERVLEDEMRLSALKAEGDISLKRFADYYRESVKEAFANARSLSVVPLLMQEVGGVAVFGRDEDALVLGSIADSLALEYPGSRYVSLIRSRATILENRLRMRELIGAAGESMFPNLSLPSISGEKVSLSYIALKGGKSTLVYFYDATDPAMNMYTLEKVKPWCDAHKVGSVYAVNVGADKNAWAKVVRSQNLPWTHVCDTRGTSLAPYGVTSLPSLCLIESTGVRRLSL